MKNLIFALMMSVSANAMAGDFWCQFDGKYINVDKQQNPLPGVKTAKLGAHHKVTVAERPGFGMRFHDVVITDNKGKSVVKTTAWLPMSVGYSEEIEDDLSTLFLEVTLNGKIAMCGYRIGEPQQP